MRIPAAPTPDSARPPISALTSWAAPHKAEPASKINTDAISTYLAGWRRRTWEKKRMKVVCVRTNEAATQPCWENYREVYISPRTTNFCTSLTALKSDAMRGRAVDRIVWSSAITTSFSRALKGWAQQTYIAGPVTLPQTQWPISCLSTDGSPCLLIL